MTSAISKISGVEFGSPLENILEFVGDPNTTLQISKEFTSRTFSSLFEEYQKFPRLRCELEKNSEENSEATRADRARTAANKVKNWAVGIFIAGRGAFSSTILTLEFLLDSRGRLDLNSVGPVGLRRLIEKHVGFDPWKLDRLISLADQNEREQSTQRACRKTPTPRDPLFARSDLSNLFKFTLPEAEIEKGKVAWDLLHRMSEFARAHPIIYFRSLPNLEGALRLPMPDLQEGLAPPPGGEPPPPPPLDEEELPPAVAPPGNAAIEEPVFEEIEPAEEPAIAPVSLQQRARHFFLAIFEWIASCIKSLQDWMGGQAAG